MAPTSAKSIGYPESLVDLNLVFLEIVYLRAAIWTCGYMMM